MNVERKVVLFKHLILARRGGTAPAVCQHALKIIVAVIRWQLRSFTLILANLTAKLVCITSCSYCAFAEAVCFEGPLVNTSSTNRKCRATNMVALPPSLVALPLAGSPSKSRVVLVELGLIDPDDAH